MQIKTNIKCKPGDRVRVANYRMKGKPVEPGGCYDTEIHVYKGGSTRNSYRIKLDRQTPKGDYLFLYVGDDSIM